MVYYFLESNLAKCFKIHKHERVSDPYSTSETLSSQRTQVGKSIACLSGLCASYKFNNRDDLVCYLAYELICIHQPASYVTLVI